jgi:hypothetical protein
LTKGSNPEYKEVSHGESDCAHATAIEVNATPVQQCQSRRCLPVKIAILIVFVGLASVLVCCHTHGGHTFGVRGSKKSEWKHNHQFHHHGDDLKHNHHLKHGKHHFHHPPPLPLEGPQQLGNDKRSGDNHHPGHGPPHPGHGHGHGHTHPEHGPHHPSSSGSIDSLSGSESIDSSSGSWSFDPPSGSWSFDPPSGSIDSPDGEEFDDDLYYEDENEEGI